MGNNWTPRKTVNNKFAQSQKNPKTEKSEQMNEQNGAYEHYNANVYVRIATNHHHHHHRHYHIKTVYVYSTIICGRFFLSTCSVVVYFLLPPQSYARCVACVCLLFSLYLFCFVHSLIKWLCDVRLQCNVFSAHKLFHSLLLSLWLVNISFLSKLHCVSVTSLGYHRYECVRVACVRPRFFVFFRYSFK